MLSDSEKLSALEVRRRRRPGYVAGRRPWFNDQQKIEAVQMYLICGTMPPVSAALGINLETLNKWRYTDWWKELVNQIKAEGRVKLTGKLQKIVSKSLEVIEDRLEHGDFQYDPKTGSMVRKPISARDAARISSDFIDKSIRIESQATEAATQQAVEDRLKTIAEAFASFTNKVRKVEVEDAVQIETSTIVDVREQTGNGGEVGEGDPEGEDLADEEIPDNDEIPPWEEEGLEDAIYAERKA